MQIHPDLTPMTRIDYTRTLQRYVSEISAAQGVLSVYQFGQISHPGVSDIDLVVVVSDDVPVSTLRRVLAATRADHVTSYLFQHPPLVVPQSCVAGLGYVHSLYHLEQVWGRSVLVQRPPEQAKPYLQLAEYVDFVFAVRNSLRALMNGMIGLRVLLLSLTSCMHSLVLASAITGQPLDKSIADRVNHLRESSLQGDDAVLRSAGLVWQECIEAIREADRQLELYTQARGIVSASSARDLICHSDRFCVFETPFDNGAPGLRMPNSGYGVLWSLIGVPPTAEAFPGFYLAQFSAYADGTDVYATAHRAIFGQQAASRILDASYKTLLTTRRQIVQQIYDIVGRAGLIPMVPLGIGFRRPDRIKASRRRRLLRPIVARLAGVGRR